MANTQASLTAVGALLFVIPIGVSAAVCSRPFAPRHRVRRPLASGSAKDRRGCLAGDWKVGLWDGVRDRLDSPAAVLSGGQQQRLCIARSLALEPEVLLLDEPCTALYPLSRCVVEDLIASLRGRYTVVIVTHTLAQARRIADHLAVSLGYKMVAEA